MTPINELAKFVSQATFAILSAETREHAKMHLLDTAGAMLAGPQTFEGLAIGKLVSKLNGIPAFRSSDTL